MTNTAIDIDKLVHIHQAALKVAHDDVVKIESDAITEAKNSAALALSAATEKTAPVKARVKDARDALYKLKADRDDLLAAIDFAKMQLANLNIARTEAHQTLDRAIGKVFVDRAPQQIGIPIGYQILAADYLVSKVETYIKEREQELEAVENEIKNFSSSALLGSVT